MKIAVAVMRYATKEGVFGPSPLAVVCSGLQWFGSNLTDDDRIRFFYNQSVTSP